MFALLQHLSVSVALWVAFAAAFVISIRDFVETCGLKLLDSGSLALFGLIAFYTGFIKPDTELGTLRLIVDLGLLLLICGSIVMRRPFSLQYAQDTTPEEFWTERVFLRTNYVVTMIWAIAFAIMSVADAVLTIDTSFPLVISVATGLVALAGALVFTLRYPAYAASRKNKP